MPFYGYTVVSCWDLRSPEKEITGPPSVGRMLSRWPYSGPRGKQERKMAKIEGLTIEVIPKPGTEEFDQLAKQFAESAFRHFVELWRQGSEQNPAATSPQFLATE
jgi:hypothetical protein